MTNEEIRERIASLESDKEELLNELDNLTYLESKRQLTKDELRQEANIRKRIQEIDSELISLERQLLNSKEQSTFAKRLALSLGTIALCGILGVFISKTVKKNCAPVQSVPDKSISDVATPVPTAKPTATPEPTAEPILVDVTNDEDVAKAANIIYNEDVKPMLEELDNPALNDFVTVEAIEDIIRMVNGELPVYSDYNEYTIGENVNLMNNIFANQGNANKLYPMDFSKLYPTGSTEAKYIQTYDDIYKQIAIYRAEGNADGVVEKVGEFATKLVNEWCLAGMYGGYNPYLFPAEEQYFLLKAATSRFSNYMLEYLISNDLTVCVPACYDVNQEAYNLVEVRDIVEALNNGTSYNGKYSVIRNGEAISISDETATYVKAYFGAKANVKVKSLG